MIFYMVKKYNIAIIGGGWVGCHLANKFNDNHQITIFEKNKNLFYETSFNNQNRLHFGFHYSRSSKTRNICKNTFDRFINDYQFLIEDLPLNLYCIPKNDSIIDYQTFCEIFYNYEINQVETNLKHIEGCVNTKEKYIDFKKAKKFFNDELSNLVINEEITKLKLKNDFYFMEKRSGCIFFFSFSVCINWFILFNQRNYIFQSTGHIYRWHSGIAAKLYGTNFFCRRSCVEVLC